MDPASAGWRRYVALMVDAISTSNPSRLPRAVPVTFTQAGPAEEMADPYQATTAGWRPLRQSRYFCYFRGWAADEG
jgi:hypothetical protein